MSIRKGTQILASAVDAYSKTESDTLFSKNNEVVKLTGNQTIAGEKTFSNVIKTGAGQGINIQGTSHTFQLRSAGATPEGAGLFLDNNTENYGFKANESKITIGGGTVLPHSMTPSTSDNSTRIATTAYVQAQKIIKTTYTSGTSGYRIWSDGYCEQWGKTVRIPENTTTPISLLKTFSSSNYNIQITIQPGDNDTKVGKILTVDRINKTGSSFSLTNNGWSNSYNGVIGYWVASGYLASGQY